ncbi:MAG TPA: GreA/GreB family elongation factor, partial [Sphingobacteriaceae bacterium]
MNTEKLIIQQKELDLLNTHLLHSNLSEYNKNKLLEELKSAEIVEHLPADVVGLKSLVEIQDKVSGQKFTFQLVLPAEANVRNNKVSVFAPIGIALLGYRTGSEVQWEMPSG